MASIHLPPQPQPQPPPQLLSLSFLLSPLCLPPSFILCSWSKLKHNNNNSNERSRRRRRRHPLPSFIHSSMS
ncbi:hypothetical protein ACLKA6_006946 [Drosophila palustris]